MRRGAVLAVASACATAAALAVAQPATGGGCAPPGTGPLRVAGADLVLDGATGALLARWPLRDAGGQPGAPIAVCQLPSRQSLVVVIAGWQELWEISTNPAAEPIYDGLVHDYRMGEAIARPGYLGVRRIALARPWVAVFSDARVPWLVGAELGDDGTATAVVLHLAIRRAVARLPLGPARAAPLQGAALLTGADGTPGPLVLPAADGGRQVLDPRRWPGR